MPSFDALEAIMIAEEMCADVPIIIISGTIGEDVAVETLRKGAYDYLMKDRLERLESAISRALQTARHKLEHKKAEEKIELQAKEWHTTFNSIASCVFLMDTEFIILRCNKAAEQFLGRTADEIIGRHCWEIVHGTQCPIAECPVLTSKKGGKRATHVLTVGDKFLQVTVDPVFDNEGSMTGIVHVIDDITEQEIIKQKLHSNLIKLDEAQILAKIGFWTLDLTSMNITWSKGTKIIFGLPPDAPNPTCEEFLQYIFPDDRECVEALTNRQLKLMPDPTIYYEYRIISKTGSIKYLAHIGHQVVNQDGQLVEIVGSIQDITIIKRAEFFQCLSENVIRIIGESDNFHDTAHRILVVVKEMTLCDAIGIRLQSDDDFPYFEQDGFPLKFLLTENSLLVHNSDGSICREIDGTVKLECLCGKILSGRTNPDLPFFTRGGSFWTNSTTNLTTTTKDGLNNTIRNRCNKEGYESVALIPIRANAKIIGLLQLNGYRKNLFNLSLIEAMEGTAKHIGNALVNKGLQEDKKKSEKQFMNLLHTSKDAILLIDKNTFIECNNATVEMLGYRNKEEFLMTHPSKLSPEFQPDGSSSIEKANAMIDAALEKGYYRFEWIHTKANGQDFPVEVSLTPISYQGKTLIHCVWRDISEIKKSEKELLKKIHDLEIFNKAAVEREIKMIELKKKIEELKKGKNGSW